MPLNPDDSSGTNVTPTRYFFPHQWALGKFTPDRPSSSTAGDVLQLERETIGNVVNGPF